MFCPSAPAGGQIGCARGENGEEPVVSSPFSLNLASPICPPAGATFSLLYSGGVDCLLGWGAGVLLVKVGLAGWGVILLFDPTFLILLFSKVSLYLLANLS